MRTDLECSAPSFFDMKPASLFQRLAGTISIQFDSITLTTEVLN